MSVTGLFLTENRIPKRLHKARQNAKVFWSFFVLNFFIKEFAYCVVAIFYKRVYLLCCGNFFIKEFIYSFMVKIFSLNRLFVPFLCRYYIDFWLGQAYNKYVRYRTFCFSGSGGHMTDDRTADGRGAMNREKVR